MPVSARRSIALVPAHKWRPTPEALQWRPDAICFDLGDLLSSAQRGAARQDIRDAVALVSGKGIEPFVRLSVEEQPADLRAVVWPGLSAVVVPGLRVPRDVWQVDSALTALEQERGIAAGAVGVIAYLDHGRGVWYAREIAVASRRVQALVLGMGDLAFDMLKEPEIVPFFTGPVPRFPVHEYVWGRLALVGADTSVHLLGSLGATIAPGHAQKGKLLEAARLARQMGFKGALTLHREGVEACNAAFAPSGVSAKGGR